MDKYLLVYELVEEIDSEKLRVLSKFLKARISNPDSYLLFMGETSSGKSTIINGLLGDYQLQTKSYPTTGAITEVVIQSDYTEPGYYAINKNATMEKLNAKVFKDLTLNPDENLERLRMETKIAYEHQYNFENLRIFDTPGYNAILDKHEKVLKEFLPNCDVLVYTVSYKIGIQDSDYAFLGLVKELIREDVPVLLAVNRCPDDISNNDSRIKEIKRYVEDLTHSDVPLFIIPNIEDDPSVGYPLPKVEALWEYINIEVNKPDRRELLNKVFNGYIHDLFNQCENYIETKFHSSQLERDEQELIKQGLLEMSSSYKKIIDAVIEPEFKRIIEGTHHKIDHVTKRIEKRVIDNIEGEAFTKMDETRVYVNQHVMPFVTQEEMQDVLRYIEIEITALDEKVNDLLNTALVKFEKDIAIQHSTHLEYAARGIVSNLLEKGLNSGLVKYFAKYGGAGGSRAGIANAASHTLKVVGDFFGKTFSKETHNALKHLLKKIGATSAKAVMVFAAVIIEVVVKVYDYSTWKGKLKKGIKKGVGKWNEQVVPLVESDLLKLKEQNKEMIQELIDEVDKSIEEIEKSNTEEVAPELMNKLEEIKEKISNE